MRLLPALVLAGVSAAEGKKVTPCPKGCQCMGQSRDFGECKVTVVCESIAAFPSASDYPQALDCLFLNSQKLSKLGAEAKEAGLRAIPETVRRLDLNSCGLETLPAGDALGRLGELRVLNLEFNKLRELPKDAFHGLEKLKVLWLTGNHYQKGEKEYKKMKALGNKLEALDEAQFKGLENLQVLLMHHNQLRSLPHGLFEDTKRLKVLKLLDNPFDPELERDHEAFTKMLWPAQPALYQLDLMDDSGDALEDHMEKTGTYLSDDFFLGPPPKEKKKKKKTGQGKKPKADKAEL